MASMEFGHLCSPALVGPWLVARTPAGALGAGDSGAFGVPASEAGNLKKVASHLLESSAIERLLDARPC